MGRGRITKAQLRMIHTLRRCTMDEDTYRLVLKNHFNAESTKDLSKKQAKVLIDQLLGKSAPRGDGATERQLAYLRALHRECGRPGDEGLRWAQNIVHRNVERLEDLSRREASKCIQAAKAMAEVLREREMGYGL